MSLEQRAQSISERIVADGYPPVEGEVGLHHRRKFMPSRFGMVDTLISVRIHPGVASMHDILSHQQFAVDAALSRKSSLPRGLGSAVEVFAINLASEAEETAVMAASSAPSNQWSLIAMSGLIHGPSQQAVYFTGKKLWGAAYISSLRRRLSTWMG